MLAVEEALERIKAKYAQSGKKLNSDSSRTVRGTYGLTSEGLKRNRDLILRVEAEQDKCRGCTGKCRKTFAQGFIPVLIEIGNDLSESMRMCKHERNRREQAKLKRLFQSARVPKVYATDGFASYEITPGNEEAVKAAKLIHGF